MKTWGGRICILALILINTFQLCGQGKQNKQHDSTISAIKQIANDSVRISQLAAYYDRHWYDQSRFYYQELKEVIMENSQSKFKDALILLYYTFGNICRKMAKFDEAQKTFLIGLELAKQNNLPNREVDIYLSLGTLFMSTKEFNKVLAPYEKGIDIAKRNRLDFKLNQLYQQYGIFYSMQNKFDSANKYLYKALALTSRKLDPENYGYQIINIGINLKKQKKELEALKLYKEAKWIGDSLNNEYMVAGSLANEGWAYLSLNNPDISISNANKVIETVGKTELDFVTDMYDLLQQAYEKLGDYKNAFWAAKQFKIFSDSIFNRDRLAFANELNTKYEVDLKDAKYAKEKLFNKNITNTFIIVSAFLILIAILIGLFLRNAQRKNNQLAELNEKIESKSDELEKLNNIKTVLFSVISHDLRSPLNSLKLFIDRLLQGKIDSEKIPLYLKDISGDVNGASDMINNLLDWSQAQMQGYNTRIEEFNLNQIVTRELEKLNYQIQLKSIQVISNLDRDFHVQADQELTSIIIRNLMSNAIKFTHNGLTIVITFDSNKNTLSIKDAGIGMDSQQLELLKNKEVKLSRKGTNNEKGTGLGLMICQNFSELMNCKLDFISREGEGTTALFHFPIV